MATSKQANIADGIRSGRIDPEQAARLLEGGKAQVRLSGRFPAGTDVVLRERTGTRFSEGEKIVARKKVSEDSTVVFTTGVEAGEKYWIVGEVDDELRVVAMTGKVPAAEKVRRERPDADAARPHQRDDPRWSVERQSVGVAIIPSGKVSQVPGEDPVEQSFTDGAIHPEVERHPGLSQSDVPSGTQQRSDTPLGEATPVDPSEHVPQVPQSAVDGKTPQRSDTDEGAAALIPADEGVPGVRQEDVADGVAQRSDTPLGEATPIPGGPVEAQQLRDSSERQAYGGDVALEGKAKSGKPGTQKLSGNAKTAATTTKRSTSRRSPAKAKPKKAGPRKQTAAAKKASTRKK